MCAPCCLCASLCVLTFAHACPCTVTLCATHNMPALPHGPYCAWVSAMSPEERAVALEAVIPEDRASTLAEMPASDRALTVGAMSPQERTETLEAMTDSDRATTAAAISDNAYATPYATFSVKTSQNCTDVSMELESLRLQWNHTTMIRLLQILSKISAHELQGSDLDKVWNTATAAAARMAQTVQLYAD